MVLRQENREEEAATEGRLDLQCPVTLWTALGTMEPAALPTTQPSLEHSKDGAHSGLEELSNVPWSPQLLGLEFPAPASFYTVTQATYYSTLRMEFWQGIVLVGAIKGESDEKWDSSTPVFVLAHSTRTSTQDTTFPKALVDAVARVGREDVLPPCGHCPQLQLPKRNLSALAFHGGSGGKESACSVWDPGLILGSGRYPGEGNGNPLQYSCLENPMDRSLVATLCGVIKSRARLNG